MSRLGRIGTCISLDVETKSMFNDLKMQGVNMSESIREHIRWLHASRLGQEPKTWVEHHWEAIQDDRREYEDALSKILNQQDRFIYNLPRNIAMHEKSQSMLTAREKHRAGRFQNVSRFYQKYKNDPDDAMMSREWRMMTDWAEGQWNELEWGQCPDFTTIEGIEIVLEELKDLENKKFIQRASIEQIEIHLEAEGKIPDLMIENKADTMNLLGDGL